MTSSPGPWRLTRTKRFVTNRYGAPHICEMDTTNSHWEDNANLVAMTPDLLDALKALLEEAEDVFVCLADATGLDRHSLPASFKRASAVIAKATGASDAPQ